MVEMKPSKLKLKKSGYCPSSDEFTDLTNEMMVRYIDLIRHGFVDSDEPSEWLNTDHSICFEIYQPTVAQLADLAVILANMHPTKTYSQHATDGHCLVYYLIWDDKKTTDEQYTKEATTS